MPPRILITITLASLLPAISACDGVTAGATDTDDIFAKAESGDDTDTGEAFELDALDGLAAAVEPSAIVGGQPAGAGEFPFMATVIVNSPYYKICGGTLVTPTRVLTSAACLTGNGAIVQPGAVSIGIGDTSLGQGAGQETRGAAQIIVHPDYNPALPVHHNPHALAVVVLSSPSSFEPVEIASPFGPSDRAKWLPGALATALGWGDLVPGGSLSGSLQKIQLPVLADSDPDQQWLDGDFDPALQLMAGEAPAGACDGDEGGPLLVQTANGWKQIGVHLYTSGCDWGYQYYDPISPSLFSRIGAPTLHRWLKTVLHETPAVGDVNGDGRDDIVTFTHGDSSSGPLDVYVALSNGTTFGTAQKWQDWWAHRGHTPMLGDFDGDGRADIWAFTDKQVWVSRSRGYDFNGGVHTTPVGTTTAVSIGAVGDVNGDGRADAVVFANDGSADVHVMLATVSGFGPKTKWHEEFAYTGESPMLADLNGDGRADLVNFTQDMNGRQVRVALSTGTGFGVRTTWNTNFAAVGEVPAVGDFNGDGKDDVLRFVGNGWVYVGQSTGSGLAQTLRDLDFGDRSDALLVGDVDGDGKDDLLRFTQDQAADVYVARSTGTVFDPAYLAHGYFSP
ncbi:FG-GAP-like repeat-containing protein [Nannocystis pusilla]|uniref:FG-GAP-like repeat-containing protein n=1 Tax=Nannocystis pusilla TaxID=889268 RepID=A0ABS7TZU1_9BACT|nr:FG-GAP-like repeat-containing protein [Nannocystis pusilla]MBZ5713805.1 FG-GAP-like repeat-containing protein [Nannocystis pusilla]